MPSDKELILAIQLGMLRQEMYQVSFPRLTDYQINTLTHLHGASIALQQYLELRQKQIKEFSTMATWYKRKKDQLQQDFSAKKHPGVKINAVLEQHLHESFVEKYSANFYKNQLATNSNYVSNSENKFYDYNNNDEKFRLLQLYALMELFDGVQMNVKDDGFTIDIVENNNVTNLVLGKINNNNLEMSCPSEVLNDPKFCDRALLLMVDQRRRLHGRSTKTV